MVQLSFLDAPCSPSGATSVCHEPLDTAGILGRLAEVCERPRYTFMLLALIAEASAESGSAGPYVRAGDQNIAIRDWLCDAMNPVGRREARRRSLAAKVRDELERAGALPIEAAAAERAVDAEMRRRLRQSGRTNVSRGVSELVRAGLLKRHYQGDFVDHHNRGGQRQAVYTVTEETRRALMQHGRKTGRAAMGA